MRLNGWQPHSLLRQTLSETTIRPSSLFSVRRIWKDKARKQPLSAIWQTFFWCWHTKRWLPYLENYHSIVTHVQTCILHNHHGYTPHSYGMILCGLLKLRQVCQQKLHNLTWIWITIIISLLTGNRSYGRLDIALDYLVQVAWPEQDNLDDLQRFFPTSTIPSSLFSPFYLFICKNPPNLQYSVRNYINDIFKIQIKKKTNCGWLT